MLIVNVLGFTMDNLLNDYLEQGKREVTVDISTLIYGCEPREQDLIMHMVREMLIFFRESE